MAGSKDGDDPIKKPSKGKKGKPGDKVPAGKKEAEEESSDNAFEDIINPLKKVDNAGVDEAMADVEDKPKEAAGAIDDPVGGGGGGDEGGEDVGEEDEEEEDEGEEDEEEDDEEEDVVVDAKYLMQQQALLNKQKEELRREEQRKKFKEFEEKKDKQQQERIKKQQDQEKQDKEFLEFVKIRGEMQNPLDNDKFIIRLTIHYKKLYKAHNMAINGLYTYADPKRSVGVVVSFIDKTAKADQSKLTYIGLMLCDMVLFDRRPLEFLQTVLLSVDQQEKAGGTFFPEGVPTQDDIEEVFKDSDMDVNKQRIQQEVRYLQEWMAKPENEKNVIDFRQAGQSYKEKKFNHDGSVKKQKQKKTPSLLSKQIETQLAKKEVKEAKMIELEINDFDKAVETGLMESSYSSVSSSSSSYCYRQFLFSSATRVNFNTQVEFERRRVQNLNFWDKYSLISRNGSILNFVVKLRTKGKIMAGLPHTRYCVMPGMFYEDILKPKNDEDEDARSEIIILNAEMNYYGFNAMIQLYDKGLDDIRELPEIRKQIKEALIGMKQHYFQEDSKDNRESFKNSIIDFHRVEFAIDLCAFIKKLPEAQEIEQRDDMVMIEACHEDGYEQFWRNNPPVTNPITALGIMYNQLYDYMFFYDKILMFQMLCVMSSTPPIEMHNRLRRKYFNLKDFVAFDNNWSFFKFKEVMNVDLVFRGIHAREARKANYIAKNKAKGEKMANKKAAKKYEKEKKEEEKARARGTKTPKQMADEKKLQLQKDRDAKREKMNPNPARIKMNEFNKLVNKRKKQDIKEQQRQQEETVASKSKDEPVEYKDEYHDIPQGWHVLHQIEEYYSMEEYGPFIVQMNRKDDQSHRISEYVVIKRIFGQEHGCMVFNAAGPKFYQFKDFRGGRAFPLDNLYYYYTKQTVSTDEAILRDEDALKERRDRIKTFYKTCSIYCLSMVPEVTRNNGIKYRAIYDLIMLLGRMKEGHSIGFENNLKALKVLDPIQANSKVRQVFVQNQDVVEQLTLAKLAVKRCPDAVQTAKQIYPLKDCFDPSAMWLSGTDETHRAGAMMANLLEQSGLLSLSQGGINIRKGWFIGLLELQYRSQLNHKLSVNTLKDAKQQYLSAKPEEMIKDNVKLQHGVPYNIQRQVAFFMHAVATALIGYMIENKMSMDDFHIAQEKCSELVRKNQPRVIVNLEETLQEMSGMFTSTIQQQKNVQLIQDLREPARKIFQKFQDKKIEKALANPALGKIPEDFSKYLAGVILRLRSQNPQGPGQPANEQNQYSFCISQIKSKSGLFMMYQDVISLYNPHFLGTLGFDCTRAVRRMVEKELKIVLDEDENERKKASYCVMYDRNGRLQLDKQGDVEIQKHNDISKLAHWRLAAIAPITMDDVPVDSKKQFVAQLPDGFLEKMQFDSSKIMDHILLSIPSTKASSAMKSDGGQKRLVRDEDVDMSNSEDTDETQDHNRVNQYEIDKRAIGLYTARKEAGEDVSMTEPSPSPLKSKEIPKPTPRRHELEETKNDRGPHWRGERKRSRSRDNDSDDKRGRDGRNTGRQGHHRSEDRRFYYKAPKYDEYN